MQDQQQRLHVQQQTWKRQSLEKKITQRNAVIKRIQERFLCHNAI